MPEERVEDHAAAGLDEWLGQLAPRPPFPFSNSRQNRRANLTPPSRLELLPRNAPFSNALAIFAEPSRGLPFIPLYTMIIREVAQESHLSRMVRIMLTAGQHSSSQGAGRPRALLTGRARPRVLGVSLAFIAFAGLIFWRMQATDELPDVPDPFDVAEPRRPIELPDADNAFVAYAAAQPLLVTPRNNQVDLDRYNLLCNAVLDGDIKQITWSSASPGIRAYLTAKHPASRYGGREASVVMASTINPTRSRWTR